MKSILENRPQLSAEIEKVAEVALYLWQKGWAERNGGNITVNITEYVDSEMQINRLIDKGNAPEFAVVVFDLNGLKIINDTFGHQAGDKFIKDGCSIICGVFKHSPAFRIGGDEFVAIVQEEDYRNIESLMKRMENINMKNLKDGDVVIAAGMARYHKDKNVAAVFSRADTEMYNNKLYLKGLS